MPPLSVMIKPASGMCNMHCDYCFYCDETQKRNQACYGFMTEETLKNVIRRTMLRADYAISYTFQGGEPTLRGIEFFKKILEYQRQYNKRGLKVSNALQTNGFALDENWCRFLKENDFLVGISLDGTRETHNAYRHEKNGAGSYAQVQRAIKLLDLYGIDYNILTVVTKKTASRIADIYEAYRSSGFKYQQYIACLEPLLEERGLNEYAVSPEEYGQFLITLFELWYEDCKHGVQPYIRQFENYMAVLLGRSPEACDQRGTCGIQYVVEADGSVYPCDFYMLDEYCLGNFNENKLPELDAARKDSGFLERSGRISGACKGCPHFFICRGGCQRNRILAQDGVNYENYFCEAYRMFFDACLDRMKELAAELPNQ